MELMVRCALTDRPGTLATLAGAIGRVGGDIQGLEIVDHDGERVLDDLVVRCEPDQARAVLDEVRGLDGVELVHAGPSRGHPGDAVGRLAIGFEALLTGAMTPDRALTTLVGGMLRASRADLCPPAEAPAPGRRTCVLPVDTRVLVVERDYPFTPIERERARVILQACVLAVGARTPAG